MKQLILSIALLAATGPVALAAGNHSGVHHDIVAIGAAGEAKNAKRTVKFEMRESDDGQMLFEPASLKVKKGETLRLAFVNKGETDHEFVMDTMDAVMEHKALMEKFPEMEHADPNSIRLAPGARGEIVWTFVNDGDFTFACLIPGHYESGMHGAITVAK